MGTGNPDACRTRGTGEPIPQWTVRDGQLTHYPGHDNDLMYLARPAAAASSSSTAS